MSGNPILEPHFSHKLSRYLNGLPDNIKRSAGKSTHAIKTFLIENGVGEGAQGWTNQIKTKLAKFVDVEFLWDVCGRVQSPDNPMQFTDLTFVAESENRPQLKYILEDAAKLPIVRTDVRLMFFRANDQQQLETYFSELAVFFREHRRTEVGDVYLMAGQNLATGRFSVRKLTIRHERTNSPEWEVVQ